jgi:hypothetical protein
MFYFCFSEQAFFVYDAAADLSPIKVMRSSYLLISEDGVIPGAGGVGGGRGEKGAVERGKGKETVA